MFHSTFRFRFGGGLGNRGSLLKSFGFGLVGKFFLWFAVCWCFAFLFFLWLLWGQYLWDVYVKFVWVGTVGFLEYGGGGVGGGGWGVRLDKRSG